MNVLPDLYPAIVRSYDRLKRLARVEIPGITDGAELFPEAEFNYPLGDKSEHSEIRVLEGDRIWVSFAGGDPRFPVVMGYRNKRIGNSVEWRRWHHENIELEADETIHLKGKNIVIDGADSVTVNTKAATVNASDSVSVTTVTATVTASESATVDTPEATVTGNVSVGGNLSVYGDITAANVSADGDVTAAGISLKDHPHTGVMPGSALTGPPQSSP